MTLAVRSVHVSMELADCAERVNNVRFKVMYVFNERFTQLPVCQSGHFRCHLLEIHTPLAIRQVQRFGCCELSRKSAQN